MGIRSRKGPLVLSGILAVAAASAPGPGVHAAVTNWTNSAGGTFTTPTNWNNGVPDGVDTAIFDRGASIAYHVSFPGGAIFDPPLNYLIDALRVHSNNVTFRDNSSPFTTAPSLTVANPGVSIIIGHNAGELAVLNSRLIRLSGATTSIGRAAGANGTLNVSAGTFSMSGDIGVGNSGVGALNVTGGARVEDRLGIIGEFVNSQGHATVSDANSQWINSTGLFVGYRGTGTLAIQNGGSATSALGFIGDQPGSNGTATVAGSGSTWTSSDTLSVGSFGTGSLTIEAGGSVVSNNGTLGAWAGSTGTATVTGAGSTWTNVGRLEVGVGGMGALAIQSGGKVTSTTGTIGVHAGSTGSATVAGTGSTWTDSVGLVVGSEGTGSLMIESGGTVSGPSGIIGIVSGSDGTVTVSGAGSTWTSSGIKVGDGGDGTLNIRNGAHVTNSNGVVGSRGGSVGTVDVSGAGSLWTNNGNLTVGDLGVGELNIAGGGEVVVAGSLLANASSEIRLAGGKLTVNQFGAGGVDSFDWRSGTLRLTATSGLIIGAGGLFGPSLALDAAKTLEVDHALSIHSGAELFGGGTLHAGSAIVSASGELFVSGSTANFGSGLANHGDLVLSGTTVSGPVTNAASGDITVIGSVTFTHLVSGPGDFWGPGTVTFNGGMSPGASPAAVHVESGVAFGNTNTLYIEVAGPTSGSQYDQLLIAGPADIGGTLQVSLINDFSPIHGQRFDILTADPVEGRFDTHTGMRIGMLPNGKIRFFDPQYTSAALSLVYYEALPGDANFDGQVNIADYLRIDRGFARDLHGWANGDFDHNALIDGADFFIIDNAYLAQFNPSPSAAVPEPSALLSLLTIPALLRRQRRLLTPRTLYLRQYPLARGRDR